MVWRFFHETARSLCEDQVVLVHEPASGHSLDCTGGLDVIRTEAWLVYRTSSGVRLCWELEERQGPKELCSTLELTQGQIVRQSPTDATSSRWHLYGS